MADAAPFTPEQQQMIAALTAKQIQTSQAEQIPATSTTPAASAASEEAAQEPYQSIIPAIPTLQSPQKLGNPAQPQGPLVPKSVGLPQVGGLFNQPTVADIEKHFQTPQKLTDANLKVINALKKSAPAVRAVLGVPAHQPVTIPII